MTDITVSRKKQERRYVFCIVAMVAICLAVAVMELSMGALSIDPIESVLALFGIGSAQDVNTVQSIRLPRTVCAIVSGAGLALAGAALQSVLENPLASASTVGISQGAAFGASVAILMKYGPATGLRPLVPLERSTLFARGAPLLFSVHSY